MKLHRPGNALFAMTVAALLAACGSDTNDADTTTDDSSISNDIDAVDDTSISNDIGADDDTSISNDTTTSDAANDVTIPNDIGVNDTSISNDTTASDTDDDTSISNDTTASDTAGDTSNSNDTTASDTTVTAPGCVATATFRMRMVYPNPSNLGGISFRTNDGTPAPLSGSYPFLVGGTSDIYRDVPVDNCVLQVRDPNDPIHASLPLGARTPGENVVIAAWPHGSSYRFAEVREADVPLDTYRVAWIGLVSTTDAPESVGRLALAPVNGTPFTLEPGEIRTFTGIPGDADFVLGLESSTRRVLHRTFFDGNDPDRRTIFIYAMPADGDGPRRIAGFGGSFSVRGPVGPITPGGANLDHVRTTDAQLRFELNGSSLWDISTLAYGTAAMTTFQWAVPLTRWFVRAPEAATDDTTLVQQVVNGDRPFLVTYHDGACPDGDCAPNPALAVFDLNADEPAPAGGAFQLRVTSLLPEAASFAVNLCPLGDRCIDTATAVSVDPGARHPTITVAPTHQARVRTGFTVCFSPSTLQGPVVHLFVVQSDVASGEYGCFFVDGNGAMTFTNPRAEP